MCTIKVDPKHKIDWDTLKRTMNQNFKGNDWLSYLS